MSGNDIPSVQVSHAVTDDHGNGWAYTTFMTDAGETFWPSFDGETPEENGDWGWFTPEEMKSLPLHPAFKLVLPTLLNSATDTTIRNGSVVKAVGTINKVGPHGYIHGWIKVGPGDVSPIQGRIQAPDYDCSLTRHTRNGQLDPEREKLHRQIITKILTNHPTSDHPVATFLGGGTASGKSTVIKIPSTDVHVDPDEIKTQLPEYQQMIADGDPRAALFTHDESKLIASRVYHDALQHGMNVTFDSTGTGRYNAIQDRLAKARDAGYQVAAKYITVDTDEAVRRENARAAVTGRVVPESVVRDTHSAVTNTFRSALDDNLFDSAELWDNNGSRPSLIGSKKLNTTWQVHDQAAWQSFSNKSQWWQS